MTRRRYFQISCAILLVATFAAYFGSLFNNLVYFDDNIYVIYNRHTAQGLSWNGFLYAWTTFDSGNWIPVTWLSFQLDATIWGMLPFGFHATNLLLHGINVLLLFGWLSRVTGSIWRSAGVAALFGLHPLHVESVAWVSERKDVLSAFWLLATLFAYERYASGPNPLKYLTVCVYFTLGLLSKSMLVTVPLLLLLVDYWPLNRWKNSSQSSSPTSPYPIQTTRTLMIEKAVLIPLSLISGLATIFASKAHESFIPAQGTSLASRVGNAVTSYWWYIAKTFVPTGLMVYYPHPMNEVSWSDLAISGVCLSGISFYIAIKGKHRPYLIFGWCWYLISLLPVIGLLQVGGQAHADRYAYIPHIGLFVLIVWESQYWASSLTIGRKAQILIATMTLLGCACLTIQQVRVWRNTETLWKHALAIDPDNTVAQTDLSEAYLTTGRVDEAAELYQKLIRRFPEREESLTRRIEIHRKFAEKKSDKAQFLFELGDYFDQQGDLNKASFFLTQSLSVNPQNQEARSKLIELQRRANELKQ